MAGVPDVNGLLKTALANNKFGHRDFRGPIRALKFGYPLYLRPGNPVGIVMHNTSGMSELENLVTTWKAKEPTPPPSHLAIDTDGTVGQYVSLEQSDRATENTNMHLSIEFRAVENGDITKKQITSAAVVAAFAHVVYQVPLTIANGRSEKGLAHHSLFVNPKGKDPHLNCPGQVIIGRKQEILDKARELVAKMEFTDEPAGVWRVRVPRAKQGLADWIWIYTFTAGGAVAWRDPFNGKTGTGRWTKDGAVIKFSWDKSSSTESWDLPLKRDGQTGRCRIEGVDYDLTAARQ